MSEAETHYAAYDTKVEGNIIFTKTDAAINWMRKNSLWPMPIREARERQIYELIRSIVAK
ncbi:hypothetical protein N9Z18_02945 [Verrucomicrobiales bacterium]|nr:hypothetical protein [Verrucomicrobiales bacterium]